MPNAIQIEVLRAGIEYNGAALASGKVYTYKAGTTTNKTTWTDAAKTTPAANPIILDSNGRATVFGDGVYKFVIKSSADVTIYTWDNLTYFSQAEDVGMYDALDYGANDFTQATIEAAITAIGGVQADLLLRPGSWNISSALTIPTNVNLIVRRGALLTKSATGTITINGVFEAGLYQVFSGFASGVNFAGGSVKHLYSQWWGAKGNGSNDDTVPIQCAITAAQNMTQGTVFLPTHISSSYYKITAPLVISKPCSIIGESINVLIYGVGLSINTFLLDINGTINPNLEYVVLKDFTLRSNDGVPDLLNVNRLSNGLLENIYLQSGRHGVTLTGNRTFSNTFRNVKSLAGISGYTFRMNEAQGGQNTFYDCSFGGATGLGVTGTASTTILTGMALHSCNFEGCTTNPVSIIGGLILGLSFFGCSFEKNTGGVNIRPELATDLVQGLVFHGCMFETDAEASAIILGGSLGYIKGFSIMGNYVKDYSVDFVNQNGGTISAGIIAGNYLEAVPVVSATFRPGILILNNESNGGPLAPTWDPPATTPALTAAIGSLASAAPGTPDYTIQTLTQTTPYGFVTSDEAQSTLSVITNIQTRINELETALKAVGLLV